MTALLGTRTAIVVLGQSLNPDGSAPATLLSRVRKAAECWRDEPDALLVLSGGDPAGTGTSEAEIMLALMRREFDGGDDVAAPLLDSDGGSTRFVLEAKSNTTVGNAVLCLPTLATAGVGTIRLVSSEFHLPRARYFFESVLFAHGIKHIAVTAAPAPTPPPLPGDVGINAKLLAARLADERRYVADASLARMLAHHNPTPSVPLPGLDAERRRQVQQDIERLLLRSSETTVATTRM